MINNHFGFPVKPQQMERFLEVCLLLILSNRPGYGYELMAELPNYGFSPEGFNIGSLYRVLRRMENNLLVVSKWETSDQGPQKRIYDITPTGSENLKNWMEILTKRKEKINFVLSKYRDLARSNKEEK